MRSWSFAVPMTMVKPMPLPCAPAVGRVQMISPFFLSVSFRALIAGFEISKLIICLEQEQVLLLADVLLEPVFLILRQDLQDAAVKIDLFEQATGPRLPTVLP